MDLKLQKLLNLMVLKMETKILQVNGEALEDVRDINKYLFLRDVSEVKLEHLNGKKKIFLFQKILEL